MLPNGRARRGDKRSFCAPLPLRFTALPLSPFARGLRVARNDTPPAAPPPAAPLPAVPPLKQVAFHAGGGVLVGAALPSPPARGLPGRLRQG